MRQVQAYECEHTGGIFKDEAAAARSEFRALMRKAGGTVSAMGSIDPRNIFDWLASELSSGVYATAYPALMEALTYFGAHHTLITGKGKP